MPSIVYIALGSNLNNPKQQIESAYQQINQHADIKILNTSSLYQSEALTLDNEQQPDYINSVIQVATSLSPENLLIALHEIENSQGRVRAQKWGARTLDLDILLYDNLELTTDNLIIPHPEMQDRNFVLVPLSEINPELEHPKLGPLKFLLKKLSWEGLKKI